MVKILVPISGGKDSQACLKLAMQHSEGVRGLFCDTKFEHPATYAQIAKLACEYKVRIDRVCAGSVLDKSIQYGRFPGGGARHCTDDLKIKPTKSYIKALAEKQGGFEVWYGMRTDESQERNKRYKGKVCDDVYKPHEIMPSKYPKYFGEMGVRFRLPIVNWSTGDVMEFIKGEENPLYVQGFDRVGCFPCLASGDYWKEKAFHHDDFGRKQFMMTQEVSEKIGKSIWTSKGGKFRNESGQGCLICSI
jgi:3'-phosphoadenosine 5'-phosphosulfate sulfotransferase (PAPS reductase)/FAD synthetase